MTNTNTLLGVLTARLRPKHLEYPWPWGTLVIKPDGGVYYDDDKYTREEAQVVLNAWVENQIKGLELDAAVS